MSISKKVSCLYDMNSLKMINSLKRLKHQQLHFQNRDYLSYGVDSSTGSNFLSDLTDSISKYLAVFGLDDGLYRGAEDSNTVFFKDTHFLQLNTTVQSCLPSESQQHTVRPLRAYYLTQI